jgi:hypothetical protein
MNDPRREILDQVASGQLSAAEGAARLEALEPPPVAVAAPPRPPAAAGPGARQVRVYSVVANAEVVGDPSVDFAIADGPHSVRQEGDTLVIEQPLLGQGDSFSFGDMRDAVNRLGGRDRSLTVRMNPDLALRVDVKAGMVRVNGVHGPITADVQAGNCEVADFRGPLTLTTRAGNISATGRLDSGASKIRCQLGEVQLHLEKGSNVRITAHTSMGDVAIEGSGARRGSGNAGDEVVVGSGDGTLDCDCAMGSIRVVAD